MKRPPPYGHRRTQYDYFLVYSLPNLILPRQIVKSSNCQSQVLDPSNSLYNGVSLNPVAQSTEVSPQTSVTFQMTGLRRDSELIISDAATDGNCLRERSGTKYTKKSKTYKLKRCLEKGS